MRLVICFAVLFYVGHAYAGAPVTPQERMVEWTMESRKTYADPFNDVDVDVVFTRGSLHWRVPTFWRGGSRWTVRFAPPEPGEAVDTVEAALDWLSDDLSALVPERVS